MTDEEELLAYRSKKIREEREKEEEWLRRAVFYKELAEEIERQYEEWLEWKENNL